jgi:hypothetical protein
MATTQASRMNNKSTCIDNTTKKTAFAFSSFLLFKSNQLLLNDFGISDIHTMIESISFQSVASAEKIQRISYHFTSPWTRMSHTLGLKWFNTKLKAKSLKTKTYELFKNLCQMFLDSFHYDVRVFQVLFGQHRQHVDEGLAVDV